MGYGNQLVVFRHFLHQGSELDCNLAGNTAVYLVEDERWYGSPGRHYILNAEHKPRKLASRRDLCERPGRDALVGAKEQVDMVGAGFTWWCFFVAHLNLCLSHSQFF